MNDVEYVLDFVVSLGNRMVSAGANLECVNDTMTRVCLSYHLESISIYSLSSTIMVSARSADGDGRGYVHDIVMRCGALIALFIDSLNQISARERWQGWYGRYRYHYTT